MSHFKKFALLAALALSGAAFAATTATTDDHPYEFWPIDSLTTSTRRCCRLVVTTGYALVNCSRQ